ncbi:class I SAM-dependent methyltransferase [Candidatus Microthrix parvicella]|jgi:SAM-dependent methyltransferase|uniref:class I SAM-dependent methyltransferase n=1 Tax=Candidatus Neomicrothrix parvicella TaxID=41950 RepID=UPI00036477E9|nr:class I SAM-dependent methyltransferase [Candidatus Microthrix parvicella]
MNNAGLGFDPWDEHADWWQREFTEGADPEYVEQILPLIESRLPKAGCVLDVGCGEGQVTRLAVKAGLDAVGLDAAGAQLSVAKQRGRRRSTAGQGAVPGRGVAFAQASVTDLPVADASMGMVVASLVFEHVPAYRRGLAEVARVLAPGGRFLLLLNHPLLQTPDSGWIDDHILEPPEQYWRVGAYLTEADTVEEVEPDVFIRFFHRPLSSYLNTAIDAGLVLERMDEPAPPPGFVARAPEYAEAASIPRLLVLQFKRGPGPIGDALA